jgi:hypothetical protein
MKSLRDYKLTVDTPASTSNRIAWGGPFPTAIHGTVNGMKSRAIAPGDLPGASTVLLCSDPTGFLREVKAEDFIVTDGAYLPLVDAAPIEKTTGRK